jgi:hypothetical protein
MMYTLYYQGQPIAEPTRTWQETANIALAHDMATRIFGCIFHLFPGVKIHA